jgi:hypothetical protein
VEFTDTESGDPLPVAVWSARQCIEMADAPIDEVKALIDDGNRDD